MFKAIKDFFAFVFNTKSYRDKLNEEDKELLKTELVKILREENAKLREENLLNLATSLNLPSPSNKPDDKAFVLSNSGEVLEQNNNDLIKKMIEVKKEGNEIAKFLDITHLLTHMNNEAKAKAEKGILVRWNPDSVMHKLTFDDKGKAEQRVYLEVSDPGTDSVDGFLKGFNKVNSTEVSGINVADVTRPVESDPVKETEEDKKIDIIEIRNPIEILEKARKAREAYYDSTKGRSAEGSSYASHITKALEDGSLSGRGAVFDAEDLSHWVPEGKDEADLRKKLADKLKQDTTRIYEEMELENAKWKWVELGTYSFSDNPPRGMDEYVRTHPSKARHLDHVDTDTGLYIPYTERTSTRTEVPFEQQNPHPTSQVWREKSAGELAFEESRTVWLNARAEETKNKIENIVNNTKEGRVSVPYTDPSVLVERAAEKLRDDERKASVMLDKVKAGEPLNAEETKLYEEIRATNNKLKEELENKRLGHQVNWKEFAQGVVKDIPDVKSVKVDGEEVYSKDKK